MIAYRIIIAVVFWSSLGVCSVGQENQTVANDRKPRFDAELARKLGADEYGMRSYVLVTLVSGQQEVSDPEQRKEIFAGHFSNMGRLAEEGKLVLAGPLIEAGAKRGIFILNVATLEEAKKLVETDPAVKAGVFDFEMNKFYGSAALLKVNEIHRTIQKTKIE